MKIDIECSHCGERFKKEKREYDRQIRNGKTNFYCSKKCLSENIKSRTKKIKVDCPECGKEFETYQAKSRRRKCCSIFCASKQGSKYTDYKKVSDSLQQYYKNNPIEKSEKSEKKYYKKCIVCGFDFKVRYPKYEGKTCSKKCSSKLRSSLARNNPNCGGETNYKKFKYKDVWMDSSWEVNLAKWMDEKDIKWIRDKKINFIWVDEESKNRYYFPDFYLPELDIYLDPKNKFLQQRDKFKLDWVKDNYKINLISGDLKFIKGVVSKLI